MIEQAEIAVLGSGIAGCSAGLFAARLGRSTVVLEDAYPGGQLLNVSKIEDYPGFAEGIAGFDLCPIVQEQAMSAGATFELVPAKAIRIRDDGTFAIDTAAGELKAGAVIVATGSSQRSLGVPGEERLAGRGISHCASCDGPLYREKTVGVVGGGDSALQEALELAGHVGRVILFHRGTELDGQAVYARRVRASDTIDVRLSTVVEEVLGEERVSGVLARELESGRAEEVELACLFVFVGSEPQTGLLEGLIELDGTGRIPTDGAMQTALPGVFAAGDVRMDSAAQAICAAGDGATAAFAAHRFLAARESSVDTLAAAMGDDGTGAE